MDRVYGTAVRHSAVLMIATRAASLINSLPLLGIIFIAAVFSSTVHAADTTKPTAPTSLAGTAISGAQINLSWTASTDAVGVTGYHVERCTGTSCTTWSEIATPTSTAYSDVGLTTATTYRYRVRANDAAGNLSNYSSAVTVKTLDDQAPTAPTGLTTTVNSPIKITLSWTAATDNVAVKGYRIERCTGAGCSDYTQIATTTTAVTYANTGLTPVTTYQYRVRANDAAGNLSSYSTSVSATTSADTTKPTAPTALTATVVSNNQIDLSWTASTDAVGVTGYRIERCTGTTCTNYAQIATSTTAAYSNTGLATATSYRYRVRANDAAGNLSNYSSVVTATTQTVDTQAPTASSGLTATATSTTQIDVSWTASTDNVGVTGYLLERCQGTSCTAYTQIATPTTTTYSDTALTASTSYSYRVKASDAAGNVSSYSSSASATTQTPPDTEAPTAPSGLTATPTSSTQINLSWNAATDNVGVTSYRLERCQGLGCSTYTQIGSPTTNAFSDTGLTPATNYTYRVSAQDAANNVSSYSTNANAATQYAGPITFTYTYDALGRISHAAGSDGSSIDYTYDANGNVTLINRQ